MSPDRLLLARNVDWWGQQQDLGPAFDQIEVRLPGDGEPTAVADLSDGEVRIAGALGTLDELRVADDPLLEAIRLGKGEQIGVERSVRGGRAQARGAEPGGCVDHRRDGSLTAGCA